MERLGALIGDYLYSSCASTSNVSSKLTKLPNDIKKLNDFAWEFYNPLDHNQAPLDRYEAPPKLELLFFHGSLLCDDVHDLDSFWKTWLSRDENVLWPVAWLAPKLPRTRVLFISYASLVQRSSHSGHRTIFDADESIIQNLMEHIIWSSTCKAGQMCPMIFVGHGYGGIIVKKFLLKCYEYQNSRHPEELCAKETKMFLQHCKSIIYYSTPQLGSRLMDVLDDDTQRVEDLFKKLRRILRIKAGVVYESMRTKLRDSEMIMVVPDGTFDLDWQYVAPNTDYFNVSRARNDFSCLIFHMLHDEVAIHYDIPPSSSTKKVGPLSVSSTVIGSGCNGTVVLEGTHGDGEVARPVAIKRLSVCHFETAEKEIKHLIKLDKHPNVVSYYHMEKNTEFIFIALELCKFSLYELVLAQTSQDPAVDSLEKERLDLHKRGLKLRSEEDYKLWDKGSPSVQLFQIMRNIVDGLAHLHDQNIVHRDLKPQNILISTNGFEMEAKIADMGLSKQMVDSAKSFDNRTGLGTRGWQAPEQLDNRKGSPAMDIFTLGCVLYYIISEGKHPFDGEHPCERELNILKGKKNLSHVVKNPEATNLIEHLLDKEREGRPPAKDVLSYPFFWTADKSLKFLKDVKDHCDKCYKLKAAVTNLKPSVSPGPWNAKLGRSLLNNIDINSNHAKYRYDSIPDLLRLIRNKEAHFANMSEQLQEDLCHEPVKGPLKYFLSALPCRREGALQNFAWMFYGGLRKCFANSISQVFSDVTCTLDEFIHKIYLIS